MNEDFMLKPTASSYKRTKNSASKLLNAENPQHVSDVLDKISSALLMEWIDSVCKGERMIMHYVSVFAQVQCSGWCVVAVTLNTITTRVALSGVVNTTK